MLALDDPAHPQRSVDFASEMLQAQRDDAGSPLMRLSLVRLVCHTLTQSCESLHGAVIGLLTG